MKVSTEIDNNFGYEKITQLVDNIPLKYTGSSAEALGLRASNIYIHMRLSRRCIAQIKEVC
jgi:hypothetical protein